MCVCGKNSIPFLIVSVIYLLPTEVSYLNHDSKSWMFRRTGILHLSPASQRTCCNPMKGSWFWILDYKISLKQIPFMFCQKKEWGVGGSVENLPH